MKIVLTSAVLAVLAAGNVCAFQQPRGLSFGRPATSLRVATGEPDVTAAAAANDDDNDEQEENVVRKDDYEVFGRHSRPTSFATKCATLYHPNRGAERGVAPPVYFGSTFLLDDAAHGARLHEKREAPYTDSDGFVYSRWGAPTNEAAAFQIAALEGVDDPATGLGKCLLFNSGMCAITSSLMSVLKAGDHAIFPFTVYGGTHEFAENFCKEWGIEVTYVDAAGRDGPENYRKAFRENTRVVYTETPANPTMRLTDLEGVGRVVDEHYGKGVDTPGTDPHDRKRPWVMVDGTFATPYHQRVLDIPGVDVSIHSATKYLGGHSDILAGSVTSRSEPFLHGCSKVQKLITVPLNPMDSFLLARGLRTLDVRMQRHGENAIKVARMLETHPAVDRVFYPGLDSHPDRDMADSIFGSGVDDDAEDDEIRQTYGGMVTFIMAGEDEVALQRARNVCEYLSVINLAVSLGGVESLIEHPASMTHGMIPREQRLAGGLPDGLIRLSVGLERARDLVEDLRSALDRCDEDGCDVPPEN
uniref:cystathionine gamma-lyase n=1 Tax=Odontella aurita TaxID=265563 RepID=A0A7S4J5B5_9STRA|mmetsp:Transcript_38644/g.116044  ORF Transcript_38644/g.116044 Transcript_38644/m.116044 type:complete len:530 (+) Transcript_38644:188-1777(+)|eukprot:CAMPEP_0113555922 /NCGR_PEP_ID=MMETSP0015_2-20120614/16980_1 /TAXON_ID=2838 /ORGANISM="Odontella" /LENGTH=529 /DNA_ID=CAMNT_0000457241 /DNA_START=125 /DNA_END=1714 /DNA_ORIENTATION=- /assembly_acc=CAM_ASM_000160